MSGFSINVDPELQVMADLVARDAAETVTEAHRLALLDVRDAALPRWPVKTGASREGLTVAVAGLEATLEGQAAHTRWVQQRGRSAWDDLIARPAAARADEVAQRGAAAIVALHLTRGR